MKMIEACENFLARRPGAAVKGSSDRRTRVRPVPGRRVALGSFDLAQFGRHTAVVERRWIGGSCPNTNCLPSKNEIWSAKVADLVRHAAQFGTSTGFVAVDMAKVRQRKRNMVEGLITMHLQRYNSSGAELVMGAGHFVAPKTLEVRLNEVVHACSRTTWYSSMLEHTRRFRPFPASMLPGRSQISRPWNSLVCPHT
jgi:hypothetical protein